ncbi:MAG: lysine 2,3-aminomutase [Planctomycetota bacterium]
MVRDTSTLGIPGETGAGERYRAVTRSNIDRRPQWEKLDPDLRDAVMTVSSVLPFRTNAYVMDELIDWDRVPDDPIFRLTFPMAAMLEQSDIAQMAELVRAGASKAELEAAATPIRMKLNPHPAGQMSHNVPHVDGEPIPGMQHKYRETVLFFPSHGQTCHAYCTFCFRWAQFVGDDDLKFANKEASQLRRYLEQHPEVTDVLFTGGDPMIMRSSVFANYVDEVLKVDTVRTIRIGTKSVAYWPQRFTTDADADEMLRIFDRIVESGKHVALMGHYNNAVELSTPIAREAVRRIRSTGANIRMQSPLIRRINDSAEAWADLWTTGTQLGCIPYYMFVERDTGAKSYFELPLAECWEIFQKAYQRVPGTARTVRGPSMSCFPGKCHVLGVSEIAGEKAFVLEFLQARDPSLVRRPFFAKFDPTASWYDELQPFSKSDEPFFIRPEIETTPLTVQTRSDLTSNVSVN